MLTDGEKRGTLEGSGNAPIGIIGLLELVSFLLSPKDAHGLHNSAQIAKQFVSSDVFQSIIDMVDPPHDGEISKAVIR